MELTDQTGHRPWPLPEGPWIQAQRWNNILFAHWAVPPEALRSLVPSPLKLDTFDGYAWVAITPFYISGLRLRGTPAVPVLSEFAELDVRTYVTLDGRPGVYYFSMNAPNPLVVAGARAVYHMPYVGADVSCQEHDGRFHHRCRREKPSPGEWAGSYAPDSDPATLTPGSREYFLIERWALYTPAGDGKLDITEIHRLPWPVSTADAQIERNTVAQADGISLPDETPLLHFSTGVDVLIWPPKRAR